MSEKALICVTSFMNDPLGINWGRDSLISNSVDCTHETDLKVSLEPININLYKAKP